MPHPDIFDTIFDVDQFKLHIANPVMIGNRRTAIHVQMRDDDVSPDKCLRPVKNETIIGEVFIKLIQYKDACRLALGDPQP